MKRFALLLILVCLATPVAAQSYYSITSLAGFGNAGAGKASVSLTDNSVHTTGLSVTHTFSSQSLGAEASDRQIVVGFSCGKGGPTSLVGSSVTVGGISASVVIANVSDNGGNKNIQELWVASVPTGTTGDVVVTVSDSVESMGIGVWRLVGANTTAYATAEDNSDPMSTTLDIPANGVAIGYAAWNQGSPPTAATWTNLPESFDEALNASQYQTGASDDFASSQTALAITADPNAALTDRWGLVVASWAPK